ncbi:MAG: hypothetical protein HYW25_00510 [Candidatus Aenigmarchaeota archaeon]|nr:hypothetical protein [Candidatus Aenigmarchaeota archaeon]
MRKTKLLISVFFISGKTDVEYMTNENGTVIVYSFAVPMGGRVHEELKSTFDRYGGSVPLDSKPT